MINDFSTYKASSLYFPKVRVIRARKNKKINYFLNRYYNHNLKYNCYSNIETSDSKQRTNNNFFQLNSFKLTSSKNRNKPPTPTPTIIQQKISKPSTTPTINKYTFRKFKEIPKTNLKKNCNKEKMNKFYLDLTRKKSNSKLRSQGISTSDSFFTRNRSKINFRTLSLGKQENNLDNFDSFSKIMKEYGCLTPKKNKNKKIIEKHCPVTDNFSFNILKDKYAYIYMSDKSELIKHLRRIYYNPLNV